MRGGPGLSDIAPACRANCVIGRVAGETALAPLHDRTGWRTDIEGVDSPPAAAHAGVDPDCPRLLMNPDGSIEEIILRNGCWRRTRDAGKGNQRGKGAIGIAVEAVVAQAIKLAVDLGCDNGLDSDAD